MGSQQETLCLAGLISYIILQIISNSFGNVELGGKKSDRDAPKKKKSSISKWQRLFSQLEERGVWQGPQT